MHWSWPVAALMFTVGAAAYAWWPHPALPDGVRADRVLVEKAARRMSLMRGNEVLRVYPVALGYNPEGPKGQEGDGRTPEGLYRIDWRNPKSGYHLSLHIDYPSPADQARAAAAGVPPGGQIMIHALRNGMGWIGRWHRLRDWTAGCIALTNAEIDEVWRVVPDGTPIEIRP